MKRPRTRSTHCGVCGRKKTQRPGERNYNFQIRYTCSQECEEISRRESRQQSIAKMRKKGPFRAKGQVGCSYEMACKIVRLLLMLDGGGVELRVRRITQGRRQRY